MKVKKIIKWGTLILLVGLLVYYFYPEDRIHDNVIIDKIVVYKSKRQLLTYSKGELIKTYKISLGRQPIGAKEYEGDKKTPEGIYFINDKNPNSGYHKNLGVSYPNKDNIAKAQQLGKAVGGDIKIHGIRNKLGFIGKFQRFFDWTLGCIALTNKEIDELYNMVEIGTTIEIKP
jgi:murein L,D-transpeptidase YafK